MAQVRKPQVEARIRGAALELFARAGYDGTSMAAIAEAAGVATGNVYRYFAGGKPALFAQVVPATVADEHRRLVAERVARLTLPLPDPAAADPSAERLLRFWIDHRLQMVVLLDRAAGTPHARYGQEFVDQLVDLSVARLTGLETARARVVQRLLGVVFDNTRRAIVAILEDFDAEHDIRTAVQGFWSYQLAGLERLRAWASGDA